MKTFSLWPYDNHGYSPPKYQNSYSLKETYSEALDLLERQGMIQRNNCRIRFAHPDYNESAIIAREPRTQSDSVLVEKFHLRAIFSVDAKTACTAARSLSTERQRRQAKNKSCGYIFETALQGLRSLYPIVRDTCLEILILGSDELSKSQQDLVWKELDSYYADSEIIDWINGEPTIAS
jgi:hypothetical protein